MRNNFLLSAVLACATIASSPVALAAPVVATNSTYGAVIFGGSTLLFLNGIVFDGAAQTLPAGPTTVSESEVDLGGGSHRISFLFTRDTDFFPTAGSEGVLNIGFGDPLDLLRTVDLQSGFLTFATSGGAIVGQGTFLDPAVTAWDGTWLDPVHGGGFTGVGGRGVQRITLDLLVTDLPEPPTMLLLAFGLAGLGFRTSRRAPRFARTAVSPG